MQPPWILYVLIPGQLYGETQQNTIDLASWGGWNNRGYLVLHLHMFSLNWLEFLVAAHL